MILIENFEQVLSQIETERGISRSILMDAIEQALVSACRKKFTEGAPLVAKLNPLTGEAKIYLEKTVVAKPQDPELEISLKEARRLDEDVKAGDTVKIEVVPPDFGRIAAQTAKQVIVQRIREAEKDSIFGEFSERTGEIINGTVQRVENRNYLINLGRVEAILMPKDQIPNEELEPGALVKVYLVDVRQSPKGPQILISRSHPALLSALLKLEVPEIQDGIIEIKSVSRDPGVRAKVAVKSNNPAIGAVGTCVGHMGGRIQTIIKELFGEKIDVLEWDEKPATFISNSLKPAKISEVLISEKEPNYAVVVVPNDQLSLAIGKSGVNVRLAVRLTGWRLDILSEEEYGSKSESIRANLFSSIADKIKLQSAADAAEVSTGEEGSLES